MNIDFAKLLDLLMPTFLRAGILQALLNAVATPFNLLLKSFQTWQSDMRLQAAITCQVMYMEAILNYRLFGNFLRTVYLTDGDGVTVDFIVNVSPGVTVNGQLLISLIEKYKLQGKRYKIVQSSVIYTTEWGNPVCQLQELIYTAQWSDPVCQMVVSLLYIKITAYIGVGSSIGIVPAYVDITPLRSSLSIVVNVTMSDNSTQTLDITLLPTDSVAFGNTNTFGGIIFAKTVNIESITPFSDTNYNYIT
jgi:hypothetical protein